MEFKEITKQDAEISLCHELDKLRTTSMFGSDVQAKKVDLDFDGFKKLFATYLQADAADSIEWSRIQKLPPDAVSYYISRMRLAACFIKSFFPFQIVPFENLTEPSKEEIKKMLDKLVVVKLNGGLGTSMGCKGPKSVIPVRNDLTFLDLTVQQIEHLNKTFGSDVPLILMNSFNTDDDTHKVIKKYSGFQLRILTFNQSKYPRINKESLLPIAKSLGESDNEA